MADTKLTLPLHVRLPHVVALIGKLAGEPWTVETDAQGRPRIAFTATQGPLRSLRVITGPFEGEPLARALISFRPIDGLRRNWEFRQELDDEQGKQLRMPSTPLAVAVARRLTGFFGGRLSPGAPGAALEGLSPEAALFPPSEEGQDAQARQRQFDDLLCLVPSISADELFAASASCANPDDGADAAILHHLRAGNRPPRRPAGA